MDPFEPLKYEKPLLALKARIEAEGSKAVFSPLIEKFILNNRHRVVVEMQVINYIFFPKTFLPCLLLLTSNFRVSLIQRKLLVMRRLRNKFWRKLKLV